MGPRVAAPRVPLLAVLGCLAAIGVVRMGMLAEQGMAIDFYQFWAVAGAAEALPGESVYALATGERLARILLERAAETESAARSCRRPLPCPTHRRRLDALLIRLLPCRPDRRLRHRSATLSPGLAGGLRPGYAAGRAPRRLHADHHPGRAGVLPWAFPPLRFDLAEET